MGYVYRDKGRNRQTWMMKYGRVRESTGTTDRKKAEKILHARETDRDRGLPMGAALGKIRFAEAAQDLLTDYANNGHRSTTAAARRIRLHLEPAFGGWKFAEIRTPDVQTYTQDRLAAGAAAGTVNRELALLKRMFVLAIRGGKLLYRPYIPLLKEHNVRSGFFERDAFESVRRHLPDPLQPVMTFAYITGWRIDSEVLTRQWRHVDFDANEVWLEPNETKNGKPRVFPLTAELRALLLERAAARDAAIAAGHVCPWVFFRLVGQGSRGISKAHKAHATITRRPKLIKRFNKAWLAACRLAGQPGKIPHDFRRTAIRNMSRRGVPQVVAMQLAGHLTPAVFNRYNIVSSEDLTTAADRLEGLGSAAVSGSTGSTVGSTEAQSLTSSSKGGEKVRKFGGAARI